MEAKVNKAKASAGIVKPIELLGFIKKERPEFLGKMPEKRAAAIISAALVQLGKQVNAKNEGAVKVPGLGSFQVRQVVREKAGKKETVKRVVFVAAKPKAAR